MSNRIEKSDSVSDSATKIEPKSVSQAEKAVESSKDSIAPPSSVVVDRSDPSLTI